MNKFYTQIALLFLFVSCNTSSQEIDLKKYYFELEVFKTPIVYKYENPKNEEDTQYWEFSSDTTASTLTTKTHNHKVELIEVFKEKFKDNSSILINYTTVQDSIFIESDIMKNDVYKWFSTKPYSYEVEYVDNDSRRINFLKTRNFVSKEKISILGKEREAIKFKGVYKFSVLGKKEKYNFYQYSFYVEGLGFVRYDRYFPDGSKKQLILTRIFYED